MKKEVESITITKTNTNNITQLNSLEKEKITPKILITNKTLVNTFFKDFIPVAMATTFLAPLNRIKICLQNMKLISINETEKVFKPSALIQSRHT